MVGMWLYIIDRNTMNNKPLRFDKRGMYDKICIVLVTIRRINILNLMEVNFDEKRLQKKNS